MNDLQKRFPVYAAMLHLYPRSYRKAFGDQMLQTTADMLDDSKGKTDRAKMWVAIVANIPGEIVRQRLISIGESMNISKKVIVSLVWMAICAGAVLLFPELRKPGEAWTGNAGFLRLIYLALFILTFIVASPIMAALTLLGRPRSLYAKLAKI